MQKLDLAQVDNRHMKAEKRAIASISRGEVLEILYKDEETAERKAHNIYQAVRGTEYNCNVRAAGAAVFVMRY